MWQFAWQRAFAGEGIVETTLPTNDFAIDGRE